MKKLQRLLFLLLFFICSKLFTQTIVYNQSPLTYIGNLPNKSVSLGFNYNISSQFLTALFYYPEIEIQYHFLENISFFGTFNYDNSTSIRYNIFGKDDFLHNNNIGYSLGLAYLGKTSFWFLTNYEILGGFNKKNIDITVENTGNYYDFNLKTIKETYHELFIQFNFLKVSEKKTYITSIKLASLNLNKLINIKENNDIFNYMTDNNYKINSPIILSLAGSLYYSLTNRFYIKSQAGFSGTIHFLEIGNEASLKSDKLITFNLSVGLVYHL